MELEESGADNTLVDFFFLLTAFGPVQTGQPIYLLKVASDTNAASISSSDKQDTSRKDTWPLSPGDKAGCYSTGLWPRDRTAWCL